MGGEAAGLHWPPGPSLLGRHKPGRVVNSRGTQSGLGFEAFPKGGSGEWGLERALMTVEGGRPRKTLLPRRPRSSPGDRIPGGGAGGQGHRFQIDPKDGALGVSCLCRGK